MLSLDKRRNRESGVSIRTRMTLGMVTTAAILIPVVLIAALYIQGMNEAVNRITNQDIELLHTSDRISLAFLDARRSEKSYLLLHDSSHKAEGRNHLERIRELCHRGMEIAPEISSRFDIILKAVDAYALLSESLFQTADRKKRTLSQRTAIQYAPPHTLNQEQSTYTSEYPEANMEQASTFINERISQTLIDSIQSLQNLLTVQTDSIVLFAREQIRQHQKRAQQLAAWGQRNIITALLVVLVILVWLLVTLPRRAVLPIKRITNAVRRLEEGDSNVQITLDSRDELSELARHLNTALARIREFDECKKNRISILERQFRLLAQDISEGVLIVDKVPNVVMANAAIEPLLGCSAADAIGRRLRSFPNLKFLYEPLQNVLAGVTGTQTCDIPAELPGSAVCIEAIRDGTGTIIGALIVVTNPTSPVSNAEETPPPDASS